MAGGVAILLLVIILIVGGVAAFFLATTGSFLWWGKTDPRGDRIEGSDSDSADQRPVHTRPTTPAQEHTDFVGTDD
jgi:hypothetical protein